MEYEEYLEANQEVQAETMAHLYLLLQPYVQMPALSQREWISLLLLMFPIVRESHSESGRIARSFYDSERLKHVPDEELPEVWLANLDSEEFESAMTPYRKTFVQKEFPAYFDVQREKEKTVTRMVGDAARIAANGGVMTMAEATTADSAAGFARVDTKTDYTCGFCGMLISRGPVYTADEFRKNQFAYHRSCTCVLVPVFSDDYPAKDQVDRYEELYKKATKLAKDEGIEVTTAMERLMRNA